MLKKLNLSHVGPADSLTFDFGDRLNIITGDNSAGKTFLLDVAWWVLTKQWVNGRGAIASKDQESAINYQVLSKAGADTPYKSTYDFYYQRWSRPSGRPQSPGLIIYVRVDGGFSLWDPARNYWKNAPSLNISEPDRPDVFEFTNQELWEGQRSDDAVVCKGLLQDLREWQIQNNKTFELFSKILERLSPGQSEPLRIQGTDRPVIEDTRDIPTLALPYGKVPITHTSAGIKRVLGLAYLMVWAWTEHLIAARQRKLEPDWRMVVLFDEIEAHLHPKWQRLILPALMDVATYLRQDLQIQFLVATHSPMVMTSIEPVFDESKDRLFTLDLLGNAVSLHEGWAKQGDALNWLTSDVFGLSQGRSVEGERAIEAAKAWLRKDPAALPDGLKDRDSIHAELIRVLADKDPFWSRWLVDRVLGGQS
jgi:hypothetical protein